MRTLLSLLAAITLSGCYLSHPLPGRDVGDGGTDAGAPACACPAAGCGGDLHVSWARALGAGPGALHAVDVRPSGEVVAGGWFAGPADFGLGALSGGSASGFALWLSADGESRSVATFTGDAVEVTDLSFAPDGAVVGIGMFGRNATVLGERLSSAASPDGFLFRTDDGGRSGRAVNLRGAGDDRFTEVVSRAGDLVVGGYGHDGAQIDGTTLPLPSDRTAFVIGALDARLGPSSITALTGLTTVRALALAPDGSLVVGGLRASRAEPGASLVRTAPDGTPLWSTSIGGAGEDLVSDLVTTADGFYVTLGVSEGIAIGDVGVDGEAEVLVAFDLDGEVRWARALNRLDDLDAVLSTDAAGNAIVAFSFAGASSADGLPRFEAAGGLDVVVAAYDPSGAPLGALTFGGPGDDQVDAIAGDGCRGHVLVGTFVNELVVDDTHLTSGGTDGFFVRLDG